jgi:hypothetical protein
LGALLADTRTPAHPGLGHSSDPVLAQRLALEQSRYEGPPG